MYGSGQPYIYTVYTWYWITLVIASIRYSRVHFFFNAFSTHQVFAIPLPQAASPRPVSEEEVWVMFTALW